MINKNGLVNLDLITYANLSKTIMKKNSTILAGIIGVLIILYGIIISSNNYLGCSQQQYSVLNHFVSELGQYSCSTKANRFNFSLIIEAKFLLIFFSY